MGLFPHTPLDSNEKPVRKTEPLLGIQSIRYLWRKGKKIVLFLGFVVSTVSFGFVFKITCKFVLVHSWEVIIEKVS